MFAEIISLMGNEAHTPLSLLQTQGEQAALDYLRKWDKGQYFHQWDSLEPADRHFRCGNYIVHWNIGFSYIGLIRVLPEP